MKELEKQDKTATCKKACQLCSQVMQFAIAMGVLEIDPIPSLRILFADAQGNASLPILEPLEFGKLLVRIDEYGQRSGYFAVKCALQIMPYIFCSHK